MVLPNTDLENFWYILIDPENNEAWCRHLIWCKVEKCTQCKVRTKDQVEKLISK